MGAGDMDYPPPAPPPRPGTTAPSRLHFDATIAGPSIFKPAAFAFGAEKMFFVNRDTRFFLPQRLDLPRAIFDAATGMRPPQDGAAIRRWDAEGSNGTRSGVGSESDREDDEEDGDYEDGEIDGLVSPDNASIKYPHNSSGSAQSTSEKMFPEKGNSQEDQSSFGSSRGGMDKDGNDSCRGRMGEPQQVRAVTHNNSMVLVVPELHYSQGLQDGDSIPLAQKVGRGENGYGAHNGRREFVSTVDLGDSLRMHLSDPITGTLMDDAVILTCGHSFGSTGLDYVTRQKACSVCGQPVFEGLIRPNLALRTAVQAFLREEGSHPVKAQKRRRDRLEQDKCNFEESFPVDGSRTKGVQFPFTVSDHVIIKGNKRTPQRFVGRKAVVTTQCLNGWYVVKTLDNAESVKLQYRSLEKAPDNYCSDIVLSKAVHPNWL